MEKITGRWEETVGDLSKELDNTKKEFQNRQLIFDKLEEDMKKKLHSADQDVGK